MDPSSGVRTNLDVGVVGRRIIAIGASLQADAGTAIVDATGALVVPGLVDAHTHVYWAGTPLGIDPDQLAAASGVTTWIDTGSAGAGNLEGLVRHVIERSPLTIKAFVHLSLIGLVTVGHTAVRFGELYDHRLADVSACLRALEEFSSHVLGVKVRLGANSTGALGMDSLRMARAVGDASGLPIMVHIATPPPRLEDVLSLLEPGDILTHMYTPQLMGILDRKGRIRPAVKNARERGVLFDVGHGSGSFSFDVARRAIEQGFLPDFVSSDVHAYNVDGPVFDLPTTMTKMVALGMRLEDVLNATTTAPGRLVGDGCGVLRSGGRADITVLRIERKEVILGDSRGETLKYEERIVPERTILNGALIEPVSNAPAQGRSKPGMNRVDPRLTRPGNPRV